METKLKCLFQTDITTLHRGMKSTKNLRIKTWLKAEKAYHSGGTALDLHQTSISLKVLKSIS